MNNVDLLLSAPLYVAAAYLALNVAYLLAFALAGHRPARTRKSTSGCCARA